MDGGSDLPDSSSGDSRSLNNTLTRDSDLFMQFSVRLRVRQVGLLVLETETITWVGWILDTGYWILGWTTYVPCFLDSSKAFHSHWSALHATLFAH